MMPALSPSRDRAGAVSGFQDITCRFYRDFSACWHGKTHIEGDCSSWGANAPTYLMCGRTSGRVWTLGFRGKFAEVVCDAGAAPPRTSTSPPANGGNCTNRGATRRRHAEGRLLMVQNPPPLPLASCSLTGRMLPIGCNPPDGIHPVRGAAALRTRTYPRGDLHILRQHHRLTQHADNAAITH